MGKIIPPGGGWTKQPQYPASAATVSANTSSTDLYSGSTYAYNASKKLLVPVTPGGSGISVRPTPKGLALNTPNGGWASYGLNSDWLGPNTVICLVNINSVDNPWGGLFSKNTTGVDTQFAVGRVDATNSIYIGVNNASATAAAGSSITALLGAPHVLAFTHSGVDLAPAKYYLDGVFVGETSSMVGAQTAGAGPLLLGCERSAVATNDSDVDWLFFQRFARALSAAEIAAKSANVWASFAPQQRRIDVGGASGANTGTLAVTEASDTAAFTGLINHTGTLAATEASDTFAASGTVTGAGTTTGTLAVTEASDIAAFAGTVAHTGSLASTEGSDTAALTGLIAHTGSLAVTEGADVAALSGGSQVTITGSIAATEGADVADFRGPSTGTFSQEVEFRKYYMRKGKKLLMFDSVAEAEAYTQAEAMADEAIAKAHKTSRLARKRLRTRIVPLPAQTIDTDWLAEMMQRFAINLDLPALLAEQDYERVMEIHAMAKVIQDDDDDVELLLQQQSDMSQVLEGLQALQTLVVKMSTKRKR